MRSPIPFYDCLRAILVLSSAAFGGISNAASIELNNGDVLQAEIIAQDAQSLTLEHPVLGRLVLPLSALAPPNPAAQPASADEPDESEVASGVLGTTWLTDWDRELVFGVSGSDGDGSESKIHFEANANFDDGVDRWIIRNNYDRDSADGEVTTNAFFSDVKRDWLMPDSPWFYFAAVRYDWDEFADWQHRLAASVGPGYAFYDQEEFRLLGRFGIGGNKTWGDEREEFVPELLLGLEGQWKPTSHQVVKFKNEVYPNLDQTGEYRNITSLSWTIDLDKDLGLALKLGLDNEYDSLDEEGAKNDFKYLGSLVWRP